MNQLTITGIQQTGLPSVSITPDAHEQKAVALASSKSVKLVFSESTQLEAIESTRTLKALAKSIEEARQAVKAPFLAIGKEIDAKARAFTADLDAEIHRLDNLTQAYQRKLADDRRREEQRKAQEDAERQRIEEARQREIEAKRKELEELAALEREAAETLSPSVQPAAQAQVQQWKIDTKKELERLEIAAELAALEAEEIPEPEDEPAPAIKARKVYDFEVLDPFAFASQFPQLCEITPKRREILEHIKAGGFNVQEWSNTEQRMVPSQNIGSVPGLRIFEVYKLK